MIMVYTAICQLLTIYYNSDAFTSILKKCFLGTTCIVMSNIQPHTHVSPVARWLIN